MRVDHDRPGTLWTRAYACKYILEVSILQGQAWLVLYAGVPKH